MLIVLVALAALMSDGEPDGVVMTAPAGEQAVIVGAQAPAILAVPTASMTQELPPHNLNTAQQIDHWIGADAADAKPFAGSNGVCARGDDRKIHGSVSASVGTNDYSGYSAEVSIPVGETGRIDLVYGQSHNDPYGYGYGYGFPGRSRGYGYDSRGGYGLEGDRRSVAIGVEFGRDVDSRRPTPVWDRLDIQSREKAECRVALVD